MALLPGYLRRGEVVRVTDQAEMMKKTEHVIVGISGGVDSAVAACILIEKGYRVTGLHIKVLDHSDDSLHLEKSPLIISDRKEFHFPVFSLNLSGSFRRDVIDYFLQEYLSGRTPNPCMVCNKLIKWKGLLKGADLLQANLVATGHYARIEGSREKCRLLKGADSQKDQSYFLWMLSSEELSKTLLPVGNLTKQEVRELARRFGVRAAEKKESQEICFVPDNDYREVVKSARPGLAEKLTGGEIIDTEGKVIGHHTGYPFYTIGQRKGLGIASPEPLYVNLLDAEKNRIRVGGKAMLQCRKLIAAQMNWTGISPPETLTRAHARIRYRDTGEACTIVPVEKERFEVIFEKPKQSVTPGQAVVFYRGDEVIGGGIIVEAISE